MRLVERSIDLGADGRYFVAVAGDASEIDEETHNFNRAIVITFTALTIGAVVDHCFAGAVRVWLR